MILKATTLVLFTVIKITEIISSVNNLEFCGLDYDIFPPELKPNSTTQLCFFHENFEGKDAVYGARKSMMLYGISSDVSYRYINYCLRLYRRLYFYIAKLGTNY